MELGHVSDMQNSHWTNIFPSAEQVNFTFLINFHSFELFKYRGEVIIFPHSCNVPRCFIDWGWKILRCYLKRVNWIHKARIYRTQLKCWCECFEKSSIKQLSMDLIWSKEVKHKIHLSFSILCMFLIIWSFFSEITNQTIFKSIQIKPNKEEYIWN